jgi:lactobin A/cerein 7B family class IIb bacteriocin
MRELSIDEVNQVNGGAVPIAAFVVKGIALIGGTAGMVAAAHYTYEYLMGS